MSTDKILYAIVIENNKKQIFSRYIILDENLTSNSVNEIILNKLSSIKKIIKVECFTKIKVIK